MKWSIITAILILLLILEGTILQVFSSGVWVWSGYVVPRFGLVVLIFLSLYIGRRRAFFIGLVYGLFQDILYSDVIGVYAFAMAIIPYACALIYQYFQLNIILIFLTVLTAVFVNENLVYFVFHFFGLTENTYRWVEMLPTAVLNAVFAIIIFRPLGNFLLTLEEERKDNRLL